MDETGAKRPHHSRGPSVRARLAACVVVFVALLALLGGVSIFALNRAVDGFAAASNEAESTYVPVVKLRALFPQNEVAAWELVLSGNTTANETHEASTEAIDEAFDDLLSDGAVAPDQAQDLIEGRLSWIQAHGVIEELLHRQAVRAEPGTPGLASAGETATNPAVLMRLALFSSAMRDAESFIENVELTSSGRLAGQVAAARRTKWVAAVVVVSFGLTGAVAAMIAGYAVTRSILRPIRSLSAGFAELRAGNFAHRTEMTGYGNQEFARLSDDFNAMAAVIEAGRDDLAHQALHDALTGLANRVLLSDRIDHALQSRHLREGGLGLLVVDLDGFKQVNDTMGHSAGDVVLAAVAERLRACVRLGDTVARLGGDEFAVLLSDLDRDEVAFDIAARMVSSVQEPITVGDAHATVGASVGVAFSTAVVSSAEELLRNADLAMYAAKQRGKGRWDLFEATMHEQTVARAQLEGELRDALARGEFTVHYQPVVGLEDGAVTGFEALVRWLRPGRGIVPPDDFIPIAEETGLIVELGRFVLSEACRQLGEWNAALEPERTPLRMAVNLSARQLSDPDLVHVVAEAVGVAGLDPSWLVLELTETALIRNPEAAGARLAAIRGLGVRISIDDFGTGYSSLSYLQSFPLDEIKIDRSFVRTLGDPDAVGDDGAGRRDSSIVAAVIGMAHAFGYEVVAEGVESQAQLDVLVSLGCESGQGYFWAKPAPAPESGHIAQQGLRGSLGLEAA